MQFVVELAEQESQRLQEMSKNLYIFDCFGVVVSDVSTLFMNNHSEIDQEYMCKRVFRRVDTGELTNEQMYAHVAERYNLDLQSVIDEWRGYEYPLNDTLAVIREIRNLGHAVALLSNASQGYIDYLFTKFDLYKNFDKLFVSSNYRCAKPDKEFYEICVNSFDERFDKIYFTDDNPNNLIGLEQFGITPVLFTNAEDFKQIISKK